MATIQTLCDTGVLDKVDPALDDDEQELRVIYASQDVARFIKDEIGNVVSYHGTETDPVQDLDALIAEYASGLPIEFDRQVKAFRRRAFDVLQGGVWYLKTPDLRVFGWFPFRDCFIAVFADTFSNVKLKELYEGRRNQVIHYRNN